MKFILLLTGWAALWNVSAFAIELAAPEVEIIPLSRKSPAGPSEHCKKRMEQFRQENPTAFWQGIVLLGDSITEQFPHTELFGNLPVVNRGIGGDLIGVKNHIGVIDRLEESVEILEPKVISLMIGINDVIWTDSDNATILKYYEYILWKLKRDLRQLKILIVNSLLPTRGTFAKHNPRIRELNKGLEQLTQKYGVRFLDVHKLMVDAQGELKPEYTNDGIHLTRAGYEVWAEALRPIFNEVDWSGITALANLKNLHYARLAEFERENATLAGKTVNIVFLGDSLTQGFDFQKYFPGQLILNRGIAGDTLGAEPSHRGLIKRLDSAVTIPKPQKLFILIGINDICDALYTNEGLMAVYDKLLVEIKRQSPDTQIYVQSLLPVRGKYERYLPAIRDYNAKLHELTIKHNVQFIDLFSIFADKDGLLPAEFTKDGVHINDAGYSRWATALRKYILSE